MTSGPHARSASASRLAALMWPRPLSVSADVVLAAIRIVLAWIFIYYGAGKLFAWFHGPGLHATSLFMAHSAHLHPGGLFAVAGGVIEFVGGVGAGLGVATRLAGVALLCDQVMAMITVTWSHGINSLSNSPGYEFNMTLAVLALALTILGAGRVSVDAVLERRIRRRSLGRTAS